MAEACGASRVWNTTPMSAATTLSGMQRRARVGLGILALAAVLSAGWLVSPAVALAWFSTLAERPWLFAGVVLAAAVVRPLFAWPTTLLSVAVGYAYGLWGLPFALAAVTLSNVPLYYLGTHSAPTGRLTTAGRRLVAETGGVRGVAAARLFPVPSDVISIAAGVARVRLRPYLLGSALGELPWATLGIVVGVSAGRLQADGLSAVLNPWALAGMAAVALLLLAGPCYRLLAGDSAASVEDSVDNRTG